MNRRRAVTVAVAVGVALLLLVLVTRKARGQAPAPDRLGPPRYVGSYDRLPSLQAELATRERALAIARRLVTEQPPPAPGILADMQAVIDANAPKIDQLRAAVAEIVQAGQA